MRLTFARTAFAVAAFAAALLSPAGATFAAEPVPGSKLTALLSGLTLHGVYEDGSRFSEMYTPAGTLSYFDMDEFATGRWTVEGDLFCTAYDRMPSGCFSVEQASANCFVFSASYQPADLRPPKPRMPPPPLETYLVAYAWNEAAPTTCPAELATEAGAVPAEPAAAEPPPPVSDIPLPARLRPRALVRWIAR